MGNLSSLDELYTSRNEKRQSRYSHRSKGNRSLLPQNLLSTEIADLQPINIENYEELNEQMNGTKQIWHIYTNGNFNVSGLI